MARSLFRPIRPPWRIPFVPSLAVFLIQNTQNRDAKAIHLKLDELLRAIEGARNNLVNLEDLTDEELDHLQRQFSRLRRKESRRLNGGQGLSSPESAEPIGASLGAEDRI
jgi:hypothetical protein